PVPVDLTLERVSVGLQSLPHPVIWRVLVRLGDYVDTSPFSPLQRLADRIRVRRMSRRVRARLLKLLGSLLLKQLLPRRFKVLALWGGDAPCRQPTTPVCRFCRVAAQQHDIPPS